MVVVDHIEGVSLGWVEQAEAAGVRVQICPDCGVPLLVDPRLELDVIRIHTEFHARLKPRAIREPSVRLYGDGDTVRQLSDRQTGLIVDYWQEPGPLHCYTVRLSNKRLMDLVQDEIEAA